MSAIYITSERGGAGKTALCASLAYVISQQGRKVTAFKPLTIIPTTDSDIDAEVYRKLFDQQVEDWPLNLPDGKLTNAKLKQVMRVFETISSQSDVVLIDGICGLSVNESTKLIDSLNARVVIVCQYEHNLSLTKLKDLQEQYGDRLLGFVINSLTRHRGADIRTHLLPSMESEGLVFLGAIPEDRMLLGVNVNQLAQHLNGRLVACEEKTNALVEHLVVGGIGMDPGELHLGLRKNKALIVRGDRPDIQMAALRTPTSCIVLTKGIEPIEYVKYEAIQEQVPILVVQTDTLDTMALAGSLINRARFDHPLKLNRFAKLVEQHLDLAALEQGLDL